MLNRICRKSIFAILCFAIYVQCNGNLVNTGCRSLIDVITVIDASDSINDGDFTKLRDSMEDFIDHLNIDKANIQMGIVVYSSKISLSIPLTDNKAKLMTEARNLPHAKEGTNTDLGIEEMINLFKTGSRQGVPMVGIVLTDGRSKLPNETVQQAMMARNRNINMFAVGIGSLIDEIELKAIASNDGQVLKVNSFDMLSKSVADLVKFVCPTTTTSTTTTTTTTTPAPTTPKPTPPTTQPPPKGLCDGCKMVNGVGYNPHPEDCDKFLQCYQTAEGRLSAIARQCGFGQYWDQSNLACLKSEEVICRNDKCRFRGLLSYPYNGLSSCNAYWKCNMGRSEAMCCPKGYAYKPLYGCEEDPSCNDPCPPVMFHSGSCDSRPVWYNKAVYERYINGWGWLKMPCPPGTQYNPVSCVCVFHESFLSEKVCEPEVHITFDKDCEDQSGKRVYVENQNVELAGNGYAYFNGNAKLVIPRFANMDQATDFIVTMTFLPTYNRGVQGLLSNGDCCNADPTLNVVKTSRFVHYRAKTTHGKSSTFRLHYARGNWNTVKYIHDKFKLEGQCNDEMKESDAIGPIQRSAAGLQIGFSKGVSNFVGFMDDVKIYLCRPRDL